MSLFKSLFFGVFIFIFLVAYSFVFEQIPYLNQNFKQIHVLPFLQKSLSKDFSVRDEVVFSNQIAFLENFKNQKALEAFMDSVEAVNRYTGSQTGLIHFFQSLKQTEKSSGKTRIGHYGDSMIEGDLITMTLRKYFQRDFGGEGVGFMPITSVTNDFRITVKHEFSKGWILKSHVAGKKDTFDFGISGEYFIPANDTANLNVRYTAKKRQFLSTFPKSTLYYGVNDSIETSKYNSVIFDEDTFLLSGTKKVNQLVLSQQAQTELDLNFNFHFQQPIYGVALESTKGVIVDNFATRGSAGIPLTLISNNSIRQFNQYLDYKLIVLHFGVNVLSGKTNYNWYKNSMKRVINHFKQNMPNTSILVISIADKSYKNDEDKMETDPAIPLIVKAQREAARETDAAFFNLYEAMGGENSMIKWVEELEYANKDYTHLNFKGAEFAASLLYQFLIEEYEIFKNQTALHDE